MANNHILNEEILYRSIRNNINEEFFYDNNNQVVFRAAAFKDKVKQPSVDRANLKKFDPNLSKIGSSDGIVSLISGEIRAIGDVKTTGDLKPVKTNDTQHAIDVIYAPLDENIAHSHITAEPSFYGSSNKQKKAFKLLRISLARLATNSGWLLEPQA